MSLEFLGTIYRKFSIFARLWINNRGSERNADVKFFTIGEVLDCLIKSR